MKNTLFAAAFCLLFAPFVFAQTDDVNIIPKPASVEVPSPKNGSFEITPTTNLYIPRNTRDESLAVMLNDFLKSNYGFRLKTKKWKPGAMKGIFLFDRFLIGIHHKIITTEGGSQHQQCAFRCMEIGNENIGN